MGRVVLGEDDRVCRWLSEQTGGGEYQLRTAIGYERRGELVAAVTFDNLTGNTVFAHIASRAAIFPADLIAAVMRFVFGQLDLERLTFMFREDNARCLAFVRKLGAVFDARLSRGAAPDCDILIYVLWRGGRLQRRMAALGRL